jgi:hypothetical protein
VNCTSGGTRIGALVGMEFSGNFKDKAGWTEMVMTVLRKNTNAPPVNGYTIFVGRAESGLYLNASTNSLSPSIMNRPLGWWDAVQVQP